MMYVYKIYWYGDYLFCIAETVDDAVIMFKKRSLGLPGNINNTLVSTHCAVHEMQNTLKIYTEMGTGYFLQGFFTKENFVPFNVRNHYIELALKYIDA